MHENTLGPNQIDFFKRFLYDAELVDHKTKAATEFTALTKKSGRNTATAWELILVNLVRNNPQMRRYTENFSVSEGIACATVEDRLPRRSGSRAKLRSTPNGTSRRRRASANYSDFICATFTHDSEKISLVADKPSRDVLNLFDR